VGFQGSCTKRKSLVLSWAITSLPSSSSMPMTSARVGMEVTNARRPQPSSITQ
jgi:hypothetical protein